MLFLSSLPRTLKAGVASALFALCLGAPWGVATAQPAADAAIQATVTAWTQAWSAKDVERYLAFYAPAFKPADGQTRKAWEKQRRARVTAPQFIEVSASDIKVVQHDDARAAASFRQRYRSNLFQDETNKTLELVRDGDRWLIAAERVGSLATGAAAAPAPAPAADAALSTALGTLRVLSSLGQPLRVEVEVGLAQRGEPGIVAARLASPDTYSRAGIEFNAALLGINVSIERRDGKPVIAVTTLQPVNEPFLRLLIELESRSGRLVRDYTALLDPPARVPPTPPAAAPLPTAPTAAAPPPPAPAAPAATPAAPIKAPATAAPPTRIAEGRIRTRPAAPETSKPRAKPAGEETGRRGAAASDEDRLAHARAMKETESRIEELEKKAAELARLIETRNRQIAELEKRAADAKSAPAVAPAAKPAMEAPKPAIEAPKPAVEGPAPAPAPKPAAVAPKAAPEAKPAAKARPAPPPPAPPPSLVDEYFGDPVMLGGLGVVFLLLVGYGAYAWRKKKAAARSRLDDELPAMGVAGAAVAGAAAGEASRGASATQAKAEDVDALAEADVYMTYGRDAQAEEILREALEKGENRPVVHLKLLQIYARRRDTEEFEAEARKLKALVNGAGPEWDKAAALGRSIDPSNALYGQGESLDSEPDNGATEAPAVDFDLNAIMGPSETQAAEPEPVPPSATSVLDFDLGASTGELPVRPVAAAREQAAPSASALDLSAISLNLEEPEPASASAGSGSGGGSVSRQDVTIKIDVAKAYIEIGDNDGARELLNEVLREGSAAQQAEARQIIESLK